MLARLSGYVGVVAMIGADRRDGADALAAGPLALAAQDLARRGLLLVGPPASGAAAPEAAEPATGSAVPRLGIDLTIGGDGDAAAVAARLAELETIAGRTSHAVALVEPSPAAAEALAAWAATLGGKPVVLAPVSAVAERVQRRAQ